MEPQPPTLLPPLLSAFLLTLLMSFLLGLGLREYYLVTKKTHYFGSTRSCTLIGILGFVLFQLQAGGWLYLGGLLALAGLMGIYYSSRLAQQQLGLIGILIAFLSYLVGPIALGQPDWFLILFTILLSLSVLAGGLSLTVLLARRMGRKISDPVMALTDAVHELQKRREQLGHVLRGNAAPGI